MDPFPEVIYTWLFNQFLSASSFKEDQEPSHDAEPSKYEGNRGTELPDGYSPHGQKCDPNVTRVNDTPKRQLWDKSKSFCNDIGRLVKFITNDFEQFAF